MESHFPKQRFTTCDTFVETDESSLAERIREQRRQAAKLRQRELAAELSAVTSDGYLQEILDHMERMEVCVLSHSSCLL